MMARRLQHWGAALAGLRERPLVGGAVVAALGLLATGIVWLWQPLQSPSDAPAVTPGAAQSPRTPVPVVAPDGTAFTIFAWDDDHGTRRRAAVNSSHLDEYAATRRGMIAQDQERVLADAAEALHAGIAPIFAEIEARVPRYANWVFDWWTSWILLGRAFGWTWHALTDGPILTLPDRVQAHLVDAIQQQFDALVLESVTTEAKLAPAIDRSRVAAQTEWLRGCRKYQDGMGDFVRQEARRVERYDAVQGWLPEPDWDGRKATFQTICRPAGPLEDTVLRPEITASLTAMSSGGPVDDVILRMARPFATKLISFVVLPIIVTALIGGLVLPLFGLLPNIISGVVTGIITGAAGALIIGFSASASVDWLLNRTDEALSRPQFEADVHTAVVTAEASFEGKILDAQRRSIERQIAAVTFALTGQPAAK